MQLHNPLSDAAPVGRDRVSDHRGTLERLVVRHLPSEGDHVSAVPGLSLFRRDGPCEPVSALYEPSLSLVIRGRKRASLGTHDYAYDHRHFLLTSVDLPTVSHVIDGTPAHPFLSLMLKLDLTAAQKISADISTRGFPADPSGSGMVLGLVTEDLLEPIVRLALLSEQPQDIPFVAALITQEILYRLLIGPAGGWLRSIAMLGTRCNRIAHVISWLRENHARPVRVEELAAMAAMGVSTFHHHFAGITRMSPLQFQKRIRLHEARRLLLTEAVDAATAALRVGYESPTQFNREYRRLFGSPPIRDIASLHVVSRNDALRCDGGP